MIHDEFSTKEFLGKTISEFLSPYQVSVLMNYCKNTNDWTEMPNNLAWDRRTIDFSLLDGESKNIISDAMCRLQKILVEQYRLQSPVYPDRVNLVRMFSGTLQRPHCDDMSDSEIESVRNEYHHRNFGSVIYLNNDFMGGKTYYTEHPIEVDPEPGKLTIHPGDCNHRHSVTRVEGNIRYSLSSFWGFNSLLSVPEINYQL